MGAITRADRKLASSQATSFSFTSSLSAPQLLISSARRASTRSIARPRRRSEATASWIFPSRSLRAATRRANSSRMAQARINLSGAR